MGTTPPDPDDAAGNDVLEALAAAVAAYEGHSGADDAVAEHLARIGGRGGWNHLFGAMYGWLEAVRKVVPELPDDGSIGLAAINPATGEHHNPDGRIAPGLLAVARVEVALLNRDLAMANVLFHQAIDEGHGPTVVIGVLRRAAARISPRIPAPKETP